MPFGTARAAPIIRHLDGRCGRIDAIGCQQAIVKPIVDQKGQYLIGLKANQDTLFEQVRDWMLRYSEQPAHSIERSLDHGRGELRQVLVSRELDLLG